MMNQINVLLIEDSVYSADLNVRELKRTGFIVEHQVIASRKAMQKALEQKQWDIILSDNNMPGFSALEALEVRNQLERRIPFVVVSEDISEADIHRAIERGCNAYVSKENLHTLGKNVKEIIDAAKEKE